MRSLSRKGIAALVCDPTGEKWPCYWQTDNPDRFLQAVFNCRRCALVVDEAGEVIGHHNKAMQYIATRARHQDHSAFFVAQRARMVPPNVRGNCHYLAALSQTPPDAKILAEEFNQPRLATELPNLRPFRYIFADRFATYQTGKTTPLK